MKSILWEKAHDYLQRMSDLIERIERGDRDAEQALRDLTDEDDPQVVTWAERALGGFKPLWELSKKISREARMGDPNVAKRLLQQFVNSLGLTEFSYQGFKTYNPGRMSEERTRRLLDGIDYLVALFKKRGMEKLLRGEIKEVVLDLDYSGVAHGQYWESRQRIDLMPAALLGGQSGRILKQWVHEVFLHEFGHHIHMNYITGEARRFWDSAWDPVKDIEKARSQILRITLADRERFFVLLQRNNWDPVKTARKLKGLDKAKMAYWLRNPAFNEGLITPKTFRLTKRGVAVFSTLRDPWGYLSQEGDNLDQRKVEHRIRAIRSNLFLDDGTEIQFAVDQLKTMVERDPEIGDKAVQKIIDQIGLPTDYARKNELEDFAESWVAFMANPGALSEQSMYRMKRTLSLSGLYGKEVMRIARQVAARYAQEKALRF